MSLEVQAEDLIISVPEAEQLNLDQIQAFDLHLLHTRHTGNH